MSQAASAVGAPRAADRAALVQPIPLCAKAPGALVRRASAQVEGGQGLSVVLGPWGFTVTALQVALVGEASTADRVVGGGGGRVRACACVCGIPLSLYPAPVTSLAERRAPPTALCSQVFPSHVFCVYVGESRKRCGCAFISSIGGIAQS